MVIFHSCVSLPEGMFPLQGLPLLFWAGIPQNRQPKGLAQHGAPGHSSLGDRGDRGDRFFYRGATPPSDKPLHKELENHHF